MQKTAFRSDQEISSLLDGLRMVALRRLGDADEAEDAAHETLRRVLSILQSTGIPAGYTLESYAYGILRNVSVDMIRMRQRLDGSAPVQLTASRPSALEQLVSDEQTRAVRAALDRLSRSERRLLERCYVDGETIADIARECGEPPERVRKRKSRALAKLRSIFGSGHVSLEPDD